MAKKDKTDENKPAPIEPEVLRATVIMQDSLDARLSQREAELVELFLWETDPYIEKQMILGGTARFIDKKAGNETMALVTKIVNYRSILAERQSGGKSDDGEEAAAIQREMSDAESRVAIQREMSDAESRVNTRLTAIKGGKR